jgi:hypothetical protein
VTVKGERDQKESGKGPPSSSVSWMGQRGGWSPINAEDAEWGDVKESLEILLGFRGEEAGAPWPQGQWRWAVMKGGGKRR